MPITAPKPHVLLVEDDAAVGQALQSFVQFEGFTCDWVINGPDALAAVYERQPDAVLLDWMLPPPDGLALLQRWRSERTTQMLPIIMLTALDDEAHILQALAAGADDYVCKPFSSKELLARLRRLLARHAKWQGLLQAVRSGKTAGITHDTAAFYAQQAEHTDTRSAHPRDGSSQEALAPVPSFLGTEKPPLSLHMLGHIGIDAARQTVKVQKPDGLLSTVRLDPTVYRLLQTLHQRPEQTLDRNTLHSAVWGRYADTDVRSVDVYIKRLREALAEANPEASAQIETIRGVGYRFAAAL